MRLLRTFASSADAPTPFPTLHSAHPPPSIAALLRAAPCIPVAGGGWATPGETAVVAGGEVGSTHLQPHRPHAASELMALLAAAVDPAAAAPGSPVGGGQQIKPPPPRPHASQHPPHPQHPQQRLQQSGVLSVLGLKLVAPEARCVCGTRVGWVLWVSVFGSAGAGGHCAPYAAEQHPPVRGDVAACVIHPTAPLLSPPTSLPTPTPRCLYASRPLRALLGVRDLGPTHLLEAVKVRQWGYEGWGVEPLARGHGVISSQV